MSKLNIDEAFPKGLLRPELFLGVASSVTARTVGVNLSEAGQPSGSHFDCSFSLGCNEMPFNRLYLVMTGPWEPRGRFRRPPAHLLTRIAASRRRSDDPLST